MGVIAKGIPRGFQGLFTPVSLGYQLSVFNKKLYSQRERTQVCARMQNRKYGVATISRLLKIIGVFCRISSLLYGSFAKETYSFKEPTNGSHPIAEIAGVERVSSQGNDIYKSFIPRGATYTAHLPS